MPKTRRGRPRSTPVTPRRTRTPRQADLPGTEDRAIAALEEAADQYADIRDQRMALTLEETKSKATILRLMKQQNKTRYHHAGVWIEIVAGEDTVKVRVQKPDEDEAGELDEPAEAHA